MMTFKSISSGKTNVRRVSWVLRVAAFVAVAGVGLWARAASSDVAVEMVRTAKQLSVSCEGELARKLHFNYGDDERLNWHFIPRDRKGVSFKEMNEAQRQAADALIRSGLSEAGYRKVKDIMGLESILREKEGPASGSIRDPLGYSITIFGEPSVRGQWSWRLEGHHLSLNVTMHDRLITSVTPAFFGANPAEIDIGKRKGYRTLKAEEDRAKTLLAMLDSEQRAVCVTSQAAVNEVRGANTPLPKFSAPEGLSAAKMTDAQREALVGVIDTYLSAFADSIAGAMRRKMLRDGVEKLTFAFHGSTEKGAPHSYRIQGPGFILEYVNKHDPGPHIHSFVRSFKNDFGVQQVWER